MSDFVRIWSRLLLGPILVAAVAILVRGYRTTGDGFAAGVVAAMGIVLQFIASGRRRVETTWPVRWAPQTAIVGLLLALGVVFAPLVVGKPPLTHVPAPDAHVPTFGALEMHTAILFDAGVFLVVLGTIVSMLHWIAAPSARPRPTEDET